MKFVELLISRSKTVAPFIAVSLSLTGCMQPSKGNAGGSSADTALTGIEDPRYTAENVAFGQQLQMYQAQTARQQAETAAKSQADDLFNVGKQNENNLEGIKFTQTEETKRSFHSDDARVAAAEADHDSFLDRLMSDVAPAAVEAIPRMTAANAEVKRAENEAAIGTAQAGAMGKQGDAAIINARANMMRAVGPEGKQELLRGIQEQQAQVDQELGAVNDEIGAMVGKEMQMPANASFEQMQYVNNYNSKVQHYKDLKANNKDEYTNQLKSFMGSKSSLEAEQTRLAQEAADYGGSKGNSVVAMSRAARGAGTSSSAPTTSNSPFCVTQDSNTGAVTGVSFSGTECSFGVSADLLNSFGSNLQAANGEFEKLLGDPKNIEQNSKNLFTKQIDAINALIGQVQASNANASSKTNFEIIARTAINRMEQRREVAQSIKNNSTSWPRELNQENLFENQTAGDRAFETAKAQMPVRTASAASAGNPMAAFKMLDTPATAMSWASTGGSQQLVSASLKQQGGSEDFGTGSNTGNLYCVGREC